MSLFNFNIDLIFKVQLPIKNAFGLSAKTIRNVSYLGSILNLTALLSLAIDNAIVAKNPLLINILRPSGSAELPLTAARLLSLRQ